MNRFFFSYPFFWVCLSAFFLGAGFSKATCFIRKEGDREKLETRKWIVVCIFFSLSIIFAMCAFLLPASKEIAKMKYLYLYLFITGISFLGFRFKKAFGLPVLFLFIFSSLIILLFFQSLTPLNWKTGIAEIHMLSIRKDSMTMKLILPDNRSRVLTMKGTYFAPVVKVVIFDDVLVFSGINAWYRFGGITTFEKDPVKEILSVADSCELQVSPGFSERLFHLFEEYDKYIPGVKSVQTEIKQNRAEEFIRYSIRIQDNGAAEIMIIK